MIVNLTINLQSINNSFTDNDQSLNQQQGLTNLAQSDKKPENKNRESGGGGQEKSQELNETEETRVKNMVFTGCKERKIRSLNVQEAPAASSGESLQNPGNRRQIYFGLGRKPKTLIGPRRETFCFKDSKLLRR